MIPYEDLVAALTSWRARQGLPVSHVPAAVVSPGSGSSGPARTAPPMAPPARGFAATPPPLAPGETHDEALDVDDAALLEETHYENEGDDFAMKFAGDVLPDDESTSIGSLPERDSFGGSTAPGGHGGDGGINDAANDDANDAPAPPPRDQNEDW